MGPIGLVRFISPIGPITILIPKILSLMQRLFSIFTISLLLAACSSEQPDTPDRVPEGSTHVQLSLSPAVLGGGNRSRAWTDTNAQDGEMMHQATVVVADAQDKVVLIRYIKPQEESERELIDLGTLSNGTYRFINFGNITPATGSDENRAILNGVTYAVGSGIPSGALTATTTASFNHFDLSVPSEGIPMTNVETHTLTGGTERLELQLYRQLAKMRLQLANETQHKVQITGVRVDGITPDGTAIDYFPTLGADQHAVIHWPDGTAPATETFMAYQPADGAAPFELDQGQTSNLPDVYLNESSPDHVTGQVPLAIDMKCLLDDGTWDSETRHALMTLDDIPRNSMVLVPVRLVDYMLELEAFFYPPIGGYPAFTLEKHQDEYYVRFRGEGDFQFIPHLYLWTDKDSPSKWFSLNDSKVLLQTDAQKPSITVSDADGIFSTVPHIDPVTGEILGTLSGVHGHATVTLTVYVRVNESETYQYNRLIHVFAESD